MSLVQPLPVCYTSWEISCKFTRCQTIDDCATWNQPVVCM